MSSSTEEKESLKLIITEQKADYSYLLHIFNRLRAAEGLLLTAAFGAIAYLYYAGPVGKDVSLLQRFFFPQEDYGRVIYFIAMAFFAYGVYKLMRNVFGNNPWMTAYDRNKDSYPDNELGTLKYVKKQYEECFDFNSKRYFKRREDLSFLFYCVLVSAIILIVIKTLG